MPNILRDYKAIAENNKQIAELFASAVLQNHIGRISAGEQRLYHNKIIALILNAASHNRINLQHALAYDPSFSSPEFFQATPLAEFFHQFVTSHWLAISQADDNLRLVDERGSEFDLIRVLLDEMNPVVTRLRQEDASAAHRVASLIGTIERFGYLPEIGPNGLLLGGQDIDAAFRRKGLFDGVYVVDSERIKVAPTADLAGPDLTADIAIKALARQIDAARREFNGLPGTLLLIVNVGNHFVKGEFKFNANGKVDISMEDSMPPRHDGHEKENNRLALMRMRVAARAAGIHSAHYTGEQTDSFSCPYFATQKIFRRLGFTDGMGAAHIHQVKLALVKDATRMKGLEVDRNGTVVLTTRKTSPDYLHYCHAAVAHRRHLHDVVAHPRHLADKTTIPPALAFNEEKKNAILKELTAEAEEKLHARHASEEKRRIPVADSNIPAAMENYKYHVRHLLFNELKTAEEVPPSEAKVPPRDVARQIKTDAQLAKQLQEEELQDFYRSRALKP